MIIYGVRTKELDQELLSDKCENCGTQNSIQMHVFQKYAHIFWMPVFPAGKTAVSQCDHCKQILQLKKMPTALKLSYENLKTRTRTPIWIYSGLAVIVVLITVGIGYDKQKDEKNAVLILTPKVGDVFEVKMKPGQYTLFKVDAVEGDSVFVQMNNYETNKSSGLSDLKSKAYSDEFLGYTKSELKHMLDRGEIMDIDRQ